MNRRRNLVTAALLLGVFFSSHVLVVQSITHAPPAPSGLLSPIMPKKAIPDFAAITDIKARKKAFLDFMQPLVDAENQRVKSLRQSIKSLPKEKLASLADEYEIDPSTSEMRKSLLRHIDELPASLVIAQAAIESAWGTSRFAQMGNNLFGEWCFKKGCGIVPQSRHPDANHEVRRFKSAADSIRSYIHNINSHKAYHMLRTQRADQRTRQHTLNGCYLASGLQSYSQKGLGYVEMVKTVIRSNKLEATKEYCAPTVIATPKQQTADQDKPDQEPPSDTNEKESA